MQPCTYTRTYNRMLTSVLLQAAYNRRIHVKSTTAHAAHTTYMHTAMRRHRCLERDGRLADASPTDVLLPHRHTFLHEPDPTEELPLWSILMR